MDQMTMDAALQDQLIAALRETESQTPANTGYVKCPLCNNIVDEEDAHLRREHAHFQHLPDMLKAPLLPPPPRRPDPSIATSDSNDYVVGLFAVSLSQNADRGEAAFEVMRRAQRQLHRILDGVQGSRGSVYVFGSIVSMGCWDGVGDGDFAFIDPAWYRQVPVVVPASNGTVAIGPVPIVEEDDDEDAPEGERGDLPADTPPPAYRWDPADAVEEVAEKAKDDAVYAGEARHEEEEEEESEDAGTPVLVSVAGDSATHLTTKALSLEKEKRIIRCVAARLRDAGFRFEELDPVLHTRIPVVRRKQTVHRPLNLREMNKGCLIRICFDRPESEEKFRKGRLFTLLNSYHATEAENTSALRHEQRSLILSVPDSADAVALMSCRERINGVRKVWMTPMRTVDIFAIDFDLSCRFHGIRNSWLLRRYLEQDPVYRLGNVFLKRWSKACGINNSRVGFLTSYAISVLWIYFLLRRGEAGFVDPAEVPVLPGPTEQMEVSYLPLWPPLPTSVAEEARVARLGALLRDFFYFYGEEFDWATQVVSIRQPCCDGDETSRICTKVDLGWETSDTLSFILRNRCYHIFSIEDVYEDDLDLGRHLTKDKAGWTRLQFRLAYANCRVARRGGTSLLRLLDVPQQRAADVLKARLYRHLLLDLNDAASTVADLVLYLCSAGEEEDTDNKENREDPVYLLCAYELGHRLCDLWYDVARLRQDTCNQKAHGRRPNNFVPPANPSKNGEWVALCCEDLEEEAEPEREREQRERWVQLTPPEDAVTAAGAPKRLRRTLLMKEINRYNEFANQLHPSGGAAQTPRAASAALVGVAVPKSAKKAVYPHCFYALPSQRLFGTYDARAVFVQCLEDVAWELARLADLDTAEAQHALTSRDHLHQHLKDCSRLIAAALPGYAEVLRYVVLQATDYVQFERVQQLSVLMPSALLKHVVETGAAPARATAVATAIGASAVPPSSSASRLPRAVDRYHARNAEYRLEHKPGVPRENGRYAKNHKGGAPAATPTPQAQDRVEQQQQPPREKPRAPRRPPSDRPKMNASGRKVGTCGQCHRHQIEVYPTTKPQEDTGYYCAKCWSKN